MQRTTVALLLAAAIATLTGCTVAPPPEVMAGVVEAPDGLPIVYDARGAGETTLVFVHCWACDREFWREQIDVFAEEYRVVAIDLAGHGASGAERTSWSIAELAEDVRAVVEELDLERVILVGHSLGGPVSLLAAPLLGERVVGIACVDTLHNAEQTWDADQAAPIIKAFTDDFAGTNRLFIKMMFPQERDEGLVEWVTTKAIATDETAAIGLMNDFPNLDLAQAMADSGVPIRCVNAAPLGMLIPETAIETNRSYADFDAAIVEGVGHYLLLERPDEVNEKLKAAIAELDGQ